MSSAAAGRRRGPASASDRGRPDHPGAVRRRLFRLQRPAFRGGTGQAVRSAGQPRPRSASRFGCPSVALAGRHADCMIATEPEKSLPRVSPRPAAPASQGTVRSPCYDTDEDAARLAPGGCGDGRCRAGRSCPSCPSHVLRCRLGHVTKDDIATLVPCGPTSSQSPPSGSGSRPVSPTSPSSRLAATTRPSSCPGSENCCPRCASSDYQGDSRR